MISVAGSEPLPVPAHYPPLREAWYVANYSHTSSTTTAMTADRLYFTPQFLPYPVKLDAVYIEVTSGAGNARVGIYRESGGLPGDLIADLGEQSISAAGLYAFPAGLELPAGWYFTAAVFSSTPSMRTGPSGPTSMHSGLGTTAVSTISAQGLYVSHTYGALPSTYPGSPTYLTTSGVMAFGLAAGPLYDQEPAAFQSRKAAPTGAVSVLQRAPAHPTLPHVSGRVYQSSVLRPQHSTTTSFSANTLYATPFVVPTPTTYSGLQFRNSTVSGNARVGVYEDDNGVPGALVVDVGTSTLTGTSDKTVTAGSPFTLAAGRYWLAIVTDATVSIVSQPTTMGGNPLGLAAGTDTTTIAGVSGAHTYGALPDPFPASLTLQASTPGVAAVVS